MGFFIYICSSYWWNLGLIPSIFIEGVFYQSYKVHLSLIKGSNTTLLSKNVNCSSFDSVYVFVNIINFCCT